MLDDNPNFEIQIKFVFFAVFKVAALGLKLFIDKDIFELLVLLTIVTSTYSTIFYLSKDNN